MLLLELRHFREIKIPHLHRRHDHVERFLAAGADWSSHGFYVRQHLNQALVETEIAHSMAALAVLYEEGAIAGHAGENLFIRIDFTDVPQPRYQHAPLSRSDHLINGHGHGRGAE